jgi:hypothetical protein
LKTRSGKGWIAGATLRIRVRARAAMMKIPASCLRILIARAVRMASSSSLGAGLISCDLADQPEPGRTSWPDGLWLSFGKGGHELEACAEPQPPRGRQNANEQVRHGAFSSAIPPHLAQSLAPAAGQGQEGGSGSPTAPAWSWPAWRSPS